MGREGGRGEGRNRERQRQRLTPSFTGRKMLNRGDLKPQLSDHSCKLSFFHFLF